MNKVYLIGLPGAGKSYSGKKLAEALGWKFVDLDYLIQDMMKKSVTSVFEDHGEEVFRQLEEEVLKSTEKMNNTVISCGGGTPVWADNMDWMQRHGLTVFLNPGFEKILPRILKNEKKRPMFSGLSEAEIKRKLSEISEKRGEVYSRARLIWNKDAPDGKLYFAVNQLIAMYSARF